MSVQPTAAAHLLLGVLLSLSLGAAMAGKPPKGPGPAPSAAQQKAPQQRVLHVPPFTTPPTLSVFGPELARALADALKRDHQEAEITPGEPEVTIQGRLEELPGIGVRLHATYATTTVQATGDLEHIDEMLQELVQQLQPALDRNKDPRQQQDPVSPPAQTAANPPGGARGVPVKKDPHKPSPNPAAPAQNPKVPPPPAPPPPDLAVSRPAPPPDMAVAAPAPPPPQDPPAPPPRPTWPVPAPVRVAVHIVGEPPPTQAPPGFYGAGLGAQQAMAAFLQHRLHISATPIRIIGLVGGLDALSAAQRVRARYSLMGRFDSLTLTQSVYGGLTLSGRIHIVLLFDGKSILDRSYMLPPTPFTQAEPAPTVTARAVTAVLESIAGDLQRRIDHEARSAAASDRPDEVLPK